MRAPILIALTVFFFAAAVFGGAKEHFIIGQEYYDQGRYQEAVSEFEKAYALDPKPLLLYNIAQAYEKSGKLAESVVYLKQFLKEDKQKRDTKTVKQRIANLEARIAKTGVTVTCEEPGAMVYADGSMVGVTPIEGVVPLGEGMHEILVRKEGFKPFKMNVGVSVGYAVPVFAKMEVGEDEPAVAAAPVSQTPMGEETAAPEAAPEPQVSQDSEPSPADLPPAEPEDKLRVVPWVLAGTGAAVAVVGFGVFGGMAVAQNDTTKAAIADGVGFGGAALAVAGLTWGIIRTVKKKKERARALLMPAVTRRTAGLALLVEF